MIRVDLKQARRASAKAVEEIKAELDKRPAVTRQLTAIADHIAAHPELDAFAIYGVQFGYTGTVEVVLLDSPSAAGLRAWAATFDEFTSSAKRMGRPDDPGKHVRGKVSTRLGGFDVAIVGTLPSDEFPPENGAFDWSAAPLDPPAVTG